MVHTTTSPNNAIMQPTTKPLATRTPIGERPKGGMMTPPLTVTDLTQIALFRGVTREQLESLNQQLHRKTFAANTHIITAEQPGDVVYIILSGTVKIHIEQADGTDVIIAILGAGDTVGEMSLLDSAGRSASVITLEDSELLWMDRVAFQACLRTVPAITNNLVRIILSRLRLANAQIQALATLDVYGRIARQMLAFGERYGQPDGNGGLVIPIRLTQGDIADCVGASRKRVNQVMVTYKNLKLISVDPSNHITILNRDRLAERCK